MNSPFLDIPIPDPRAATRDKGSGRPAMRSGYNAAVLTNSHPTLDYAPHSRRLSFGRYFRFLLKIVMVVLLIPALLIGLGIFGNMYAENCISGVSPGMTRSQVDRYLWPLTASPSTYDAGPAVAYSFLWYGKWTEIKVIFDANGIVVHTVPSFAN